METYLTQYGRLNGIGLFTLHENGKLKDCTLEEQSVLSTPCGSLTPQYTCDFRKKNNYAVSFYDAGTIRRISLNNATDIMSPIGNISAELIIFYENGNMKRLFPLNGQLSGYWDEKDEYRLAKEISIKLDFGNINAKVIAFSFYKDGKIKDLTFWPDEKIKLQSPIGIMNVRIGLSIYPNGSLKSVEPAYSTKINTPIGPILAYDKNANGICGDKNSLNFTIEGKIRSLITSGNKIKVNHNSQPIAAYSPLQKLDIDEEELLFKPLLIEFFEDTVIFNKESEFSIHTNEFVIEPYHTKVVSLCENCESCGKQCKSSKEASLK